MSNALKAAVTGTQVIEHKRPEDIFAMLKVWAPEIQRALPKHMNVDRMGRIAITEIRKSPALGRCKPISLFAAILSAAQMGLEIGMGRCFLVPYKDECTLIPGWKGLVELANRSGRSSCWTGAVFQGDQFTYGMGDTPFIKHVPMGEDDPALLTHVYAVGRVKGSEWPIVEIWPIAKIWKHRDRYNKQGTKHYSYREQEMYARKIPLLQVLKYLPSSPELEAAMVLAQNDEQHLTLEGVLGPDGPVFIEPQEGVEVDQETGEVTKVVEGEGVGFRKERDAAKTVDSEPVTAENIGEVIAYSKVADAINKSTNADFLDIAVDLIRSVKDEAQRAELDVMARAKRKTFK